MTESKEELKSLLMRVRVKKLAENSTFKKLKIMASSPTTSRQTDGEKVETVTDFTFLGSKITAEGDCSHQIKRCLLLGRKAITSLDSVLKSRDITLSTKLCIVKAMVFLVVTYGCESDHKEGWALGFFQTVVLKTLLRVPWRARSNQSTLKEINCEYSLEALMLKLQYFGYLMPRADSLENPDAGKDWRQKGATAPLYLWWYKIIALHVIQYCWLYWNSPYLWRHLLEYLRF